MIDVALSPDDGAPLLVRSFAACLASVTEIPIDQLPGGEPDLGAAIGRWRTWLAGRSAGLVPIAGAARFNWPGYWIAVVGDDDGDVPAREPVAVLMFGTPAGVVLSPQRPELLGRAAVELPVSEGYLVASLDPVPARLRATPHLTGTVESIAVAEHAGGPMTLVPIAQALAGRGLAGDRYAAGAGTFTPKTAGGRGYALTLIAAEVLDDLELSDGRLGPAESRRNVVTRGIDLNALVGRRFRIGGVQCLGQRLCEPCSHLEQLTRPGILRALIHRGGLRADVLTDGQIALGDVVETVD